MDDTLPDDKAITAPVPPVDVTVEDRFKAFPVEDITHIVLGLSDARLDSIMQSVAGVPYNFDKPWPFWFFIGKIMSKHFFGNEQQLEWFNAKPKLQVIEVSFLKPQPGEDLKLFWKPASGLICQRVRRWLDYLEKKADQSGQEVG